jgi:UDP-N-acetylglucosamine 2-epimerase (non-hydrolysing)
VFVSGNPSFEVIRAFLPQISESKILTELSIGAQGYVLVTAHRSENVDDPRYLAAIFEALGEIHRKFGREVVYPMHPRTRSKIGNITIPKCVKIIAPLGFYDFNHLLMHSWCILSDSGTAPEEALFYRVPCVSLRMTTERPETVEGGAHIVAGLRPQDIVASVETAVMATYAARYDLEDGFSPSSVVVNCIRSRITNFF